MKKIDYGGCEDVDLVEQEAIRRVCQLFGADSIRFLDEDAFRLCVGPASCMACMNGRYVDVDPKNGRK